MFNKNLAGQTATVPESIHESKTLNFDSLGNLEEELSSEAEEMLLSMEGYEKGKIKEAAKPKITKPVSAEAEILKAKLAKRDEDLKVLEEKLKEGERIFTERGESIEVATAELVKVQEALEASIVELAATNKKATDFESELAKVKEELKTLKAKKK